MNRPSASPASPSGSPDPTSPYQTPAPPSPHPTASPPGGVVAGSINPKDHIAPGTGFQVAMATTIAVVGGLIGVLFGVVSTFGVGLVVLLIGLYVYFQNVKQQRVLIDGSALRIGPAQFPTIHTMVDGLATRMNLPAVPDTYIYETSDQNAASLKVRGKPVMLLTDDMVWGASSTKDPKVLQFVIAHELAHHALGHTRLFRSWIAASNKKLSRLDEFSCDAVAAAVVGDAEAAAKALVLLAVGPQLLPKVNLPELMSQADAVATHKLAHKAEKQLTHPMLLRRIARLRGTKMKLK